MVRITSIATETVEYFRQRMFTTSQTLCICLNLTLKSNSEILRSCVALEYYRKRFSNDLPETDLEQDSLIVRTSFDVWWRLFVFTVFQKFKKSNLLQFEIIIKSMQSFTKQFRYTRYRFLLSSQIIRLIGSCEIKIELFRLSTYLAQLSKGLLT